LHGGIAQAQRTRVMNKFKAGGFDFLVATDVAGRGIDVDDLELVVNFDLPYDPEDYVHRIGRTGRAGKQGVAVSLVTGRDVHKIRFLEKFTHSAIRRGKLPTAGEIGEKRTDALLERVRQTIESGTAKAQMVHVDRLLEEGADSTEVAAALFHIMQGGEPAAPAAQPTEISRPAPERGPANVSASPDEPPRKPKPGQAWLRLAIGRGAVKNPRDIVDLLVEGAGLAAREVGFIALGDEASYAEVPFDFAKGLSPAGNALPTSRGDISVWPVGAAPKKKRR
jgi:ATP-dependent RNA helicase DeaD